MKWDENDRGISTLLVDEYLIWAMRWRMWTICAFTSAYAKCAIQTPCIDIIAARREWEIHNIIIIRDWADISVHTNSMRVMLVRATKQSYTYSIAFVLFLLSIKND